MLTTKEASTKLREAGLDYSAETVAKLARQGSFPGARRPERSGDIWQIPERDIQNFIRQRASKRRWKQWISVGTLGLILAIISATKDGRDLYIDLYNWSTGAESSQSGVSSEVAPKTPTTETRSSNEPTPVSLSNEFQNPE